MEKLRVKKLDSLSILKTSISISIMIGSLIALLLLVRIAFAKLITSSSVGVIETHISSDSYIGFPFLGIFAPLINLVGIAILITLVSMLYNLVSKLFGGIIIYVEKKD